MKAFKLLSVLVATSSVPAPALAQVDLSGSWRLDSTSSTTVARAVALHAQDNGFRTYSSLPGGQPVPAGVAPGSGRSPTIDLANPRSVNVAQVTAEVRPLIYDGDRFDIVQTDSTITFHPLNLVHDNVMLKTDGRKRDVLIGLDTEVQVKAEWHDDYLKVERKTKDLQATERWSVDGGQLINEIEMKGRVFRTTLKFRLSYLRNN